ncbi:unnamed protein product [Arctogadus glacialis]
MNPDAEQMSEEATALVPIRDSPAIRVWSSGPSGTSYRDEREPGRGSRDSQSSAGGTFAWLQRKHGGFYWSLGPIGPGDEDQEAGDVYRKSQQQVKESSEQRSGVWKTLDSKDHCTGNELLI